MDKSDKKKAHFEKLQQDLYSRQHAPIIDSDKRTPFKKHDYHIKEAWQESPERSPQASSGGSVKMRSWGVKLLIASVIFLLIAGGISAYFFIKGLNVVSVNNVGMTVHGPVSISSGEPLAYEVVVTNNNSEALANVKLIVDYPPGTKAVDNPQTDLSRYTQPLDSIKPGGTVRVNLNARLFGEKDSTQTILFSLEYGLPDSSGIFVKKISYGVSISSAPIVMTVDQPKDIFPGQVATYKITLTSNSNTPVNNLMLHVEYPYRFTVASSNPKPFAGNSIWHIDSIDPGKSTTVTVTGSLQGQANEQQTLTFSAGTQSLNDPTVIAVTFVQQQDVVIIANPIIDLSTTLDTKQPDVTTMGTLIRAKVNWKNNSSDTLNNVQLDLKLSSAVLNKASVNVSDNGYYQSTISTIMWNKNTTPVLISLKPGDSGSFNVSFSTNKPSPTLFFTKRNPQILLDLSAAADRSSGGRISADKTQTVKVLSDVEPTVDISYSGGPFTNTGPYPPRTEQKTTYTVTLKVKNSYNNLSKAEITATLPVYVQWSNKVSPTGAVTFDPATRQVVWNVGDVTSGAGFTSTAPEASFQVSFTPSANQVGAVPTILSNITFTAMDNFAQQTISQALSNLTTHLTTGTRTSMFDTGAVIQ